MAESVIPGRNDPCPCGSGKKYKKCHGATTSAVAATSPERLAIETRQAMESGDHRRALTLAQILRRRSPNHPEAIRLCGLAHLALGDWQQARRDLDQLLKLVSDDAAIHSNLGFALLKLNRLDDAERECRLALRLDPQLADAHNNLAQVFGARGDIEGAVAAYRHAIVNNPRSVTFRFNLGALFQQQQGNQHEAEQSYREALAIDPNFAPALANLGVIYLAQERREEAMGSLLKAHSVNPNNVEVLNNLGIERLQEKDYSRAAEWFRRAIEVGNYLPAYANLGVALESSGDMRGAIKAYREALDRDPKNEISFKNLAKAIVLSNDVEEAHRFITRAERDLSWLTPDFYPWFMHACLQTGDTVRLDKIRPMLFDALEHGTLSDPDLWASLLLLNYDDSIPEKEIFRFHLEWANRAIATMTPAAEKINKPAYPKSEKIRLGYLSPVFRRHSVGYFFRNIMMHHDKSRFEIYCYANMRGGDDFTDAIKQRADRFELVRGLADQELAERINADGIDILIELAGHTRDGRAQVLAARPAPVQAVYLGYPNTTGGTFVDYWITDVHAHSVDDDFHTEKLLRLPESFLCFGGTEERPLSPTPPALKNGYVTFGSFNNLAKLSRTTLRLWAETLKAVPNSRLMLKANGAASAPFAANVTRELGKQGIEKGRIALLCPVEGLTEHLDCYNQVDLAFDPIPYNGTTTTCEALWMGVPVLTLVGAAHRQRVTYSVLKNAGVEDTITWSESEFVSAASRLAHDLDALGALRARTARQFRASILCDASKFTRQFEGALLSTVQ